MEQREERIGEEKGSEDVKGREAERRGEGTGTVTQTAGLLSDACCC